MQCPTVRIDDGKDSFIIINEDDFDKSIHKLYVEKEKVVKEGSVPWLKKELNALGVDIPEGAKKAELQKLLDSRDD